MIFTYVHNNINVLDMDRSVAFYEEALGLNVVRTKEAEDGSYCLKFLECPGGSHQIELTWLRDFGRPYNLGDNEFHMAFTVADYDAAHALHEKLGCIVFENTAMGLYFIADPDGYWIEILPEKR